MFAHKKSYVLSENIIQCVLGLYKDILFLMVVKQAYTLCKVILQYPSAFHKNESLFCLRTLSSRHNLKVCSQNLWRILCSGVSVKFRPHSIRVHQKLCMGFPTLTICSGNSVSFWLNLKVIVGELLHLNKGNICSGHIVLILGFLKLCMYSWFFIILLHRM